MTEIVIRIRETMWNRFDLITFAYVIMADLFIAINFIINRTPELLFVLAIVIPYTMINVSDTIKLHRGADIREI